VNHLADASKECEGREFYGARGYVSQLAKMSLPTKTHLAFKVYPTLIEFSNAKSGTIIPQG
jgi:hypothetical protein